MKEITNWIPESEVISIIDGNERKVMIAEKWIERLKSRMEHVSKLQYEIREDMKFINNDNSNILMKHFKLVEI